MPSSNEIRRAFLDFFRGKDHRIVESAPVVPVNDPTLLFANAGMNQFKDVFLGTGSRPYRRVADTQKCIRMSGKHNDIEEVGTDTYHHTFFEMLGNWSFGDYFKAEAIEWAWEFLVKRAALDPARLWATVFEGNPALGVPPDDEAAALWPQRTGIAPERVLRFGMKDNFWEMAATGPCGPCSEIHYDLGPSACTCGGARCGVNRGCRRYIEIWNLVFIQYNRVDERTLVPLPSKHVDTGMGFERLVTVANGLVSNYDTDLFRPIFDALTTLTNKIYGRDEKTDVAFRVAADHLRALCVAIADGAMPDKKKRGSALRSLLRRAARFGRQALGMDRPFLFEVVPVVAGIFEEVFPEIRARERHIRLVVENEEKAFAQTLDRGLVRYRALARESADAGRKALDGEKAFDLLQQDGFPRDLIEQMAREDGLTLDAAGWDRAREKHRAASEGEGREGFQFDLAEVEGLPATAFVGYWDRGSPPPHTGTETGARLLKIVGNRVVVLDQTCFYAESGGQVGDTGLIEGPGFRFRVNDTGKIGDIVAHYGEIEEGDLSRLPERVVARVDGDRRRRIAANHTATHLLHFALKQVLGPHANQQGSVVAPDRLRFDFTHPKALSEEELLRVEDIVNEKIRAGDLLEIGASSLEEARREGVTALFGEKYGETVRVVRIGLSPAGSPAYSRELCGGTHCRGTGEIGLFKIASEEAVAAGVRRIVAYTSAGVLDWARGAEAALRAASRALKAPPEELPARIERLLAAERDLRKEVEDLKRRLASGASTSGPAVREVAGVKVASVRCPVADPKTIGEQVDRLRDSLKSGVVLVAGEGEGKVLLALGVTDDLTKRFHAGNLLKQVAAVLGGTGGGQAGFARGQGKAPEKIEEAFRKLEELVAKG